MVGGQNDLESGAQGIPGGHLGRLLLDGPFQQLAQRLLVAADQVFLGSEVAEEGALLSVRPISADTALQAASRLVLVRSGVVVTGGSQVIRAGLSGSPSPPAPRRARYGWIRQPSVRSGAGPDEAARSVSRLLRAAGTSVMLGSATAVHGEGSW